MKTNTNTKSNYWTIDGCNDAFKTLDDAKYHCEIAYTEHERIKYLRNCEIIHVVNEEVVSSVTIKLTEDGKLSFGRIKKL